MNLGTLVSASAQQLQVDFKENIDKLIHSATASNSLEEILPYLYKLSHTIENTLKSKLKLLESDYHDQVLSDEYYHSVVKSFQSMSVLLKSRPLSLDNQNFNDVPSMVTHLQDHYTQTLVPILSIISDLENVFIAISKESIREEQEALQRYDRRIIQLKAEEEKLKKKILVLGRNKKLEKIGKKIKIAELNKRLTQATLHHARLNLYYFNHYEPPELHDVKHKAEFLKKKVVSIQERINVQ